MTARAALLLLLLGSSAHSSGQDLQENPSMYPQSYKAPRPVYQQTVSYPEAAKKKGIGGLFMLELTVDTNGISQKVRLMKSAPRQLVKAATDAALRWRFSPATYYGRPVSGRYRIAFGFGDPADR